MKLLVLFYSTTGHVYRMAQAVVEGASKVSGAEVDLMRVPETMSKEALTAMGADDAQKAMAHVPIAKPDDLVDYDAFLFGAPTRFGSVPVQMRQFLDNTGELWLLRKLVGKPGGVFTSSSTQHGGQESTILGFHATMLHHGMVVVGLPYSFEGLSLTDEVSGGSPYGASTIAGSSGARQPSENDLSGARFQGMHVAQIGLKLVK